MNDHLNHQETEVKLHVPNLQGVEARLQQLGAVLTAPRVYERNLRYENAKKNLNSHGVVLRLRQDSRVRLTYKDDKGELADGISRRFEVEVTVDNFDAMALILEKLGFTPFMIYEKYRTTYAFNNCEVVLDELPYGRFVEIEGTVAGIESTIVLLELSAAPRMSGSYSHLFMQVRAALNLSFTDLTFDNFAHVAVPPTFFDPDQG